MAKTLLIPDGAREPVSVEVQQGGGQFAARVGDIRIEGELESLPGGGRVLRIGHRIVPFHVVRTGAKIEVWMDGRTHRLEIAGKSARKSGAAAGPVSLEITAPMPGTVLRVEVRPGATFAAHQPLIIMESMKMEMTLSAPHDGRVRDVLCAAGELVAMGKVLVTLEPQNDADIPA